MGILLWIRFILGTLFLLAGMVLFVVEIISVFKLDYVLNRMHAAAMGDTLGIGCCLLGLIVMKGASFTSLKLLLVIIFLWFSSPVSSHLIARLEVTTDEEPEKHYKKLEADENGHMTVCCERDRASAQDEIKEDGNGTVF